MFKFITNWFGKKPAPESEAPAVSAESAPYKVEPPAPVAPTVAPTPVAEEKAAPKKKRTFVKRQEGGSASVAKIKAPAKPKTKKR